MKKWWKEKRRAILFTGGGALTGLAYFLLVGCPGGSCAIAASPLRSMLYFGLIGWLLAGIFSKECRGGCNI